ncbi:hypothetical protein FACS189492_2800 [Clostridia bacterium]|nr:hypothetical protein FACS189492_2800 [Clostridia bacterium]
MGYETKVILKAVIAILKGNTKEDALKIITDMANAESIVIQESEGE